MSNETQHKAVYLLFCKFILHVSGCQPHPSSGVHKTVTTASDTVHIFCAAASLQRGQAWPRWRSAMQGTINIKCLRNISLPGLCYKFHSYTCTVLL